MSKINDRSTNEQNFTDELRSLIVRKLLHLKKEQERSLISVNQKIFIQLRENMLENIRTQRIERAFTTVPIQAYGEMTNNATSITKEWPKIAWENIKHILDDILTQPNDSSEINTIINDLIWPTSQHPFTLNYINPEQFKKNVFMETSRYGKISDAAKKDFDCQLGIASASASTGIINEAKHIREEISIAIDEYLLTKNQSNNVNNPTNDTSDCLPTPPKNKDDWFLAIRDAASTFKKKHGRCPNEAEIWKQLRTDPPEAYGIEPGNHHGENAIIMDGRSLGKRTFNGRWKRYTTM